MYTTHPQNVYQKNGIVMVIKTAQTKVMKQYQLTVEVKYCIVVEIYNDVNNITLIGI